ncbi:MAG TPA: hypothetical protein PLV41_05420 [Miltoncostaeales bacterium]|nr:hypothetical protein [Miltoncostaeales bacterium]
MTPPAPISTPFDQPLSGESLTPSDRSAAMAPQARTRGKKRRAATWLPASRRTHRRTCVPEAGP